MKRIMINLSNNYDFEIDEIETDKNHIHILVDSNPQLSPTMIVRILKQQSTIEIYKIYKETVLERKYILGRWVFRMFYR